jgi:hypothetical protein
MPLLLLAAGLATRFPRRAAVANMYSRAADDVDVVSQAITLDVSIFDRHPAGRTSHRRRLHRLGAAAGAKASRTR